MKKPPIPSYIGEPTAAAKSTGVVIAHIVFFVALAYIVYRVIKYQREINRIVSPIKEIPGSTNPVV